MKSPKRFSRLQKWLKKLDAPPSSKANQQKNTVRDFTTAVGLIVTGLVSSVLATWVAQEMLNNSFPLALVIGMVIILLFATVLQIRGLPFTPQPLSIIAFLLTLVAVQSIIIAYMFVTNQPPTTYIVFDATNAAIPRYPELVKQIVLTAQTQSPKSLGGLRVYGGQLSGRDDCQDTTQLIRPIKMDDFAKKLDQEFRKFDPKGNASLTIAVLDALEKDLKNYRGPIKLIIVVSGVDAKCEPELGGIFEQVTEQIRANTNKEITIAIIAVGDLSVTEEATLKQYANAFDGTFLNATDNTDLSTLLLAAPNYFSEQNESNNQP